MRQPCILTQATSNLHPEHPEHPNAKYATWLHPVLGHHLLKVPPHPDRFNNTTPDPDATPPDLLLNLSSGTKSPLTTSYLAEFVVVSRHLGFDATRLRSFPSPLNRHTSRTTQRTTSQIPTRFEICNMESPQLDASYTPV